MHRRAGLAGEVAGRWRPARTAASLLLAGACCLAFAAAAAGAPGAFSKISPASGTTGPAGGVTADWEASAGATYYEICVASAPFCPAGGWIPVGLATSGDVPGLSPGTTYYWQVRAVNPSGTTAANGGNWWSFTALVAVPAAFAKSAPVDGAAHRPASLVLSWQTSTRATSYEYCYDTTDDGACGTSWTGAGTSTSVSLSGLSFGRTYYWQVRAVNAGGKTLANGGTWWSFTTREAVQVAAGKDHTCVLTTDGTVACWGENAYGQATPPAGSFTQVSVGQSHTCAVRTDGTVAC
jgi:hypothetical protein